MGALQEIADEVHSLLSGFGLTTARTAWLGSSATSGDLSLSLDGDTVSMGEGVVEIEDELVYVRSYDQAANSLVVAPDGRGYDTTAAAAHASGTRVRLEPPYPKVSIKRAVNNAIGRCYPTIWGTATTEFDYDSSKTTYPLPADAHSVLGVTFDTWGPTGAWLDLASYSFDGDANTTEYPTGRSISLNSPATVGRTVRVTYAKVPSPLVEGDADFSATGLSETARYAVILGAVAGLLRFSDPVRLSTASAQADEFDTKTAVGSALRIANDFEAQFQMELRAEVTRLRQTYPPRRVRKKF